MLIFSTGHYCDTTDSVVSQ